MTFFGHFVMERNESAYWLAKEGTDLDVGAFHQTVRQERMEVYAALHCQVAHWRSGPLETKQKKQRASGLIVCVEQELHVHEVYQEKWNNGHSWY